MFAVSQNDDRDYCEVNLLIVLPHRHSDIVRCGFNNEHAQKRHATAISNIKLSMSSGIVNLAY